MAAAAATDSTHPGLCSVTLTREPADRRSPPNLSLRTARKGPVQLQAPGYIVLLTRALTVNLGQRGDQALGGVGTDRATFAAVTASRVALSPAG